jgi:hypothetical protein
MPPNAPRGPGQAGDDVVVEADEDRAGHLGFARVVASYHHSYSTLYQSR